MIEKETLNSRNNPLIKQLRSLNRRKSRTETGLFLVEGIHHIGVAIEADWDVNTIIYAPELLKSEYARDLISASTKKGFVASQHLPISFALWRGRKIPKGFLPLFNNVISLSQP